MFFQRTTLISLSLTSLLCFSNAAPALRKRQVNADTQSCHATDFFGLVDYTIDVGLPLSSTKSGSVEL